MVAESGWCGKADGPAATLSVFSLRLVSCSRLHSFSHSRLPQRRCVTTGLTGRSFIRLGSKPYGANGHLKLLHFRRSIGISIRRFDEPVSYRVASCSKVKANRDGWSEVLATAQTRGAFWVDNDAAYMHLLPMSESCSFRRSFFSSTPHPQLSAICIVRGSGSPSLLNIQSEAGSSNCLWSLPSSHLVPSPFCFPLLSDSLRGLATFRGTAAI